MIPTYNFEIPLIIRLGKLPGLIFFALFLFSSCRDNKTEDIIILWEDNRAIGISVPKSLLSEISDDSILTFFAVRLESQNPVGMLGGHNITDDEILFKPLIPFSRGLTYEIIFRNRQIGKIKIPSASAGDRPAIVGIYPSFDTLPENLLKIYLEFSSPMREGESQNHLVLLNNHNDTIPDVFLNLQPELWNTERTVLTIWLDPGRIKRELIPNEKMGNPLQKGEQYTLFISSNWKDVQDLRLAKSYNRKFIVTLRDSVSPDPDRWTLDLPARATNQPVVINMHEPLDYFLLQETIHIVDENGISITGSLQIANKESTLLFIPAKPWSAGKYKLRVASYLEDLAGNNLNNVFDRDITITKSTPDNKNYERYFVIGF